MKTCDTLTPLLLTLALTACSDDDIDGSRGNPNSTSTLPQTVIGEVSSRSGNSITVNDYTIDLSGIRVVYQDSAVSPQLLVSGMPVVIRTTNGASQIRLDPDLSGTVTALSDDRIGIDNTSLMHEGLSPEIATGDFVLALTASGDNGVLIAEQVLEPGTAAGSLFAEIEGRVRSLDESAMTFVLDGITVDFSAAVIKDGALADGVWVEVYGAYDGALFSASEVDIERIPDDGTTELTGTVTWVNDTATVFELSGIYTFEITGSTRYEEGTSLDLREGAVVELTLNGETLQEIEFESAATEGDASAPNSTSRPFELTGVAKVTANGIGVNGFEFVIDSRTRFDEGLRQSDLDGRWLEIEGRSDGETHSTLEADYGDNDGELDLRGQVIEASLWGYSASDNSLSPFEGQWVELECRFDGNSLSQCHADD